MKESTLNALMHQVLDREAGMQRGATAYFVKPFSPLELKALIKEILGK